MKWAWYWIVAIWTKLTIGGTIREWGPTRCYWCNKWFPRDDFWNPWGPNNGPGLTCSVECCYSTLYEAHHVAKPNVDQQMTEEQLLKAQERNK